MSWKKPVLVAVALVLMLGVAYSVWERPKAAGLTIEVYKSPT
ncbi:hypothetical protein ACFLQ0_01825 [Nitrospinota bacterium]